MTGTSSASPLTSPSPLVLSSSSPFLRSSHQNGWKRTRILSDAQIVPVGILIIVFVIAVFVEGFAFNLRCWQLRSRSRRHPVISNGDTDDATGLAMTGLLSDESDGDVPSLIQRPGTPMPTIGSDTELSQLREGQGKPDEEMAAWQGKNRNQLQPSVAGQSSFGQSSGHGRWARDSTYLHL
jgi:hypothetical protein